MARELLTVDVYRILIVLAIVGIIAGGITVFVTQRQWPSAPIPYPPPFSPYTHFIAATGIVESSSEEVEITSPTGEIVDLTYVDTGYRVSAGEPLFSLDTSDLRFELEQKFTSLAVAIAKYERQLRLPRPENIPISQASCEQACQQLLQKKMHLQLAEELKDPRAISRENFLDREFEYKIATYQFAEAEANLNLLLAGAWEADLHIYRAEKEEAEAAIYQVLNKIARATICAPFSGCVLQMNIHRGEFSVPGSELPAILFGSMDTLYLRVSIDEEEIWRLIPHAPGTAYIRGNSSLTTPLSFLYIEPYLKAKKNLAGGTNELVDTRVLEVVYEIDTRSLPIYPGELLDVFVEAKPRERSP